MPRFVILTHDHPHLHWDLMLEPPTGGPLRTWRLAQPPEPGLIIAAERLPDHRRLYLDYEGPVSGHRGQVTRWDGGEWELVMEEPRSLTVKLSGQRISGQASIRHAEGAAGTFHLAVDESDPKSETLAPP